MSDAVREQPAAAIRRLLAEQGFDDNGANPHSWRCEHPDRYPGYCTCVADAVKSILTWHEGEVAELNARIVALQAGGSVAPLPIPSSRSGEAG